MGTVRFETVQTDMTFNTNLMLDKSFMILPAKVPVSETLLKALKEWGFTEGFNDEEETPAVKETAVSSQENPKDESESKASLQQALQNDKNTKYTSTEHSRMNSVQAVYNEYLNYINSVYTYYATHRKINMTELADTVKELCVYIKENKRYILRVTPSAEARSKNFIVIHSMRSTVLAITIGLELHLPFSKLIELGMACILHEIGMLRIPPQLYMTDRQLSPAEKSQLASHTVYGFNILKELKFPLSIQLGVLEHHEKENGFGYPRHLSGSKISPYAKIISVACSFEAISAPREYKTEKSTFEAMVEMLKNQNQQYDPTVIKALLFSLSLYPIGAFVQLQNGKIGVVSDVSPNNPKTPIVQLATEREADGSVKSVQTDEGENKIIKILSKEESEEVQKNIDQQIELRNLTRALENAKQEETKDADGFSSVDVSEFS
ncbi:MAG: HD-GYP domain-containing protein [Treponema sp.]|nr:HD-GYP domain-containing protein [Treponema sp.]